MPLRIQITSVLEGHFLNFYSSKTQVIMENFALNISFKEIISAFMVLFALIDITGSIPIIIGLKQKNKIESGKVSLISLLVLVLFLFVGDALLGLFGVDISSFAAAGGIIILILASEMILDIEIFKTNNIQGQSVTAVPLVFPLIAGAGTLTSLLSMKAEFAAENIIIAIFLNIIIVYIVLKYAHLIERLIGKGGIYILRKFFGIILLAIGVKLFASNIGVFFQ